MTGQADYVIEARAVDDSLEWDGAFWRYRPQLPQRPPQPREDARDRLLSGAEALRRLAGMREAP